MANIYTISNIHGIRTCLVRITDFLDGYWPAIGPDYQTRKSVMISAADFSRSLFSKAEINTVNRFRALKKQIEWLAGRFAAKMLLIGIDHFPANPELVEIHREPGGAPFPADDPHTPISISHAGDFAIAAVASDRQMRLGIDLEKIVAPVPQHLAQVAFTAAERQELAQVTDYAAALYRKWTIKEAYLKYLRQGFAASLSQVEILTGRLYHRQELAAEAQIQSWKHGDYDCSMVFSVKRVYIQEVKL